MFKKLKKDYEDFINARREIRDLEQEVSFWRSSAQELLEKQNLTLLSKLSFMCQDRFIKTK